MIVKLNTLDGHAVSYQRSVDILSGERKWVVLVEGDEPEPATVERWVGSTLDRVDRAGGDVTALVDRHPRDRGHGLPLGR